jgi:hypothetical protein
MKLASFEGSTPQPLEGIVALDLTKERGTPLEEQTFDWFDLVRMPISKLNDDAMTRVRVIWMNGMEQEANRFSHALARFNGELRVPLARVRRVDHQQQVLVNWLLPPDQSALETTIGYEQASIEVTADVALKEPDPYFAQLYRFGMLEDFDHLYRFAALLDRVEGKDANNILQSYTDIAPGRPTPLEHRAPEDDVRRPYRRDNAHPLSRLNAVTITAAENQVRDYYMNIGPQFADPVARLVYAEISCIEEQHVTHYESIADPGETVLEKWLLHEASEAHNYFSCMQFESNKQIRDVWERFLSYELGQLSYVMDLFRRIENRDPFEILPRELPEPIRYESHREFVRETLLREVGFQASGMDIVESQPSNSPSIAYREQLNRRGSPTSIVAAGYVWQPGTETTRLAANMGGSDAAHAEQQGVTT